MASIAGLTAEQCKQLVAVQPGNLILIDSHYKDSDDDGSDRASEEGSEDEHDREAGSDENDSVHEDGESRAIEQVEDANVTGAQGEAEDEDMDEEDLPALTTGLYLVIQVNKDNNDAITDIILEELAYNPKVADDVFTRSLATPSVTLTPGELLALAPEVRSKYRELVTPKRTPANANIVELTDATALAVPEGVSVHTSAVLPPPSELINNGKPVSPGVYVVPDLAEQYLRTFPPSERPSLVVAKESHSLRSIYATVDNSEQVECVIDPGCQIIAMSQEVCHALGLQYDPTIQLHMQSANKTVDLSLGLARNVPFQIGDVTIYLQVHVIRDAAYDVLMGRPFDVVTQSMVRNFANEDQTITIKDPNSDTVVTVPTFPRGRPRFR